uniref:NF-X1-type domain-containing protein n=1 Tax=Strigamia maritima TaxID=126957 RepID=T1IPI9_STRMM
MNVQNQKPKGRGRGRNRSNREPESESLNDWSNIGRNAAMRQNLNSDKTHKNESSSKFEDACAKMQHSAKQFAQNDNQYESSDEEENENQDAILQQLMAPYTSGSGDGNDLSRTHQFILESFKAGSSVCLVCIATIKKTEAVMKFGVVIRVTACSIFLASKNGRRKAFFIKNRVCKMKPYKLKTSLGFVLNADTNTRSLKNRPNIFVFCGEEMNPKYDAWLVPHSCGNTCGKPLKPDCGHFCLVLVLPVLKQSKFPVIALKNRRNLSVVAHVDGPAANDATVCGRKLECGNHLCEVVCHAGNCDQCPKTGERTCPCGKTKHKLPCTEDVPSCGDSCNKPLECNQHLCSKRCHAGTCGDCLEMCTKHCECGHREKFLPCYKEFRCDTKCKKMRDCGRHPCNRKCCNGQCPSCEQLCNRTLTCRNHKCSSQCHLGPCYPCPLTVEIKCNCGSTVVSVPCGRERVTKPPKCTQLCRNSPDCHHKYRTKHNCHFGPCPRCRQTCEKKLTCSHSCPAFCHSAVVVKVQNEKKREGPWEPKPEPQIQVVNRACPPCKVPTAVTCLGQHETTDFACFEAKPFSCSRKCGRKLICANHSCSLVCHQVLDATNDRLAGSNCEVCDKSCSKPRPIGCPHACLCPCHPDECSSCKQMIKLRCHCQLNIIFVECHKLSTAGENEKIALGSCNNQCPKNISCGHRCPQNCHPGTCPVTNDCKKKISLRCPCKRMKKDVFCHVSKKIKFDCDEKCDQLKTAELKAKKEEEARKLEDEKKKAEAELLRYQQKMEGKKRRQRKTKEIEEHRSIFDNFTFQLVACLSVIAVAVIAIYSFL